MGQVRLLARAGCRALVGRVRAIVDAEVVIRTPGATSGAPKAGWCTHMYSSGRSLSFVTRSATTTSPRPRHPQTTRSTSSGVSARRTRSSTQSPASPAVVITVSPRKRARLAMVGVVDATVARRPSARGEEHLPASRIRLEPRLRRALGRGVATAPAEAPRGFPEHVDACPEVLDSVDVRRLDRATASPGSGRRRARRPGRRRREAPPEARALLSSAR